MAAFTRLENNEEPTPPYTNEQVTQRETLINDAQVPPYEKELHWLFIAFSVLNYICCMCCGIPAIVFTIFTYEADKKKDKIKARRNLRYVEIYNILCCLTCPIFLPSLVTFLFFGGFQIIYTSIIGVLPHYSYSCHSSDSYNGSSYGN